MINEKLLVFKESIDVNKKNWENILTTNCYAYALGIDLNIGNMILDLGDISGLNYKVRNGYGFEEALINDMLALDLKIKKVDFNYKIKNENEWIISLFSTPRFYVDGDYIKDYHFLRKTKDEGWTHKFDNSISSADSDGNLMNDPRNVIIKTNKVIEYKYVGCYLLTKNEYIR